MWFRRKEMPTADDDDDGELLVREPRHEPEVLRRPSGRVPPVGPRLDDYMKIAKKIGYSPHGVFKHELLQFCREQSIKVYPYEKVAAYMDQAVEESEEASCWVWRPLRKADEIEGASIENVDGDCVYEYGDNESAVYDKIVPGRVLKRVAAIHERFGARAKVFVSDYADRRPDPFIAVYTGDGDTPAEEGFVVFDVWDEPGFKG